MGFKSKALAAAAVLSLAGGLTLAAGASASWGATPSCGANFFNTPPLPPGCVNIFSHEFTQYYSQPTYVLDVFHQGARVGQPIILFRGSNSDPAEDFALSDQGHVSDFYAAGLVSAATELHYGGGLFLQTNNAKVGKDEPAGEIEYSPYGVGSGLCVGVASGAFSGGKVSLQPCGVSGKTIWIFDDYDQPFWLQNGLTFPLINGSNTNFSHPFVLTYPKNAEPWARPRVQLTVANLTGFSSGFGPVTGQVGDNQLWGADFGVLP